MDKEQELKQLIEQLRSQDRALARQAVDTLRERGWLKDGSLQRANLKGANLQRADLNGADLAFANLSRADLSVTYLNEASLLGTNLDGAHLIKADLSFADVRSASLCQTDMSQAEMVNTRMGCANLRKAVLAGANLLSTDLSGSDLTDASLSVAHCFDTDLRDAKLIGANLTHTYLKRSSLYNTDFTDAQFGNTSFDSVDLADAIGLATAKHDRPSTIGIDTLYLSKGKIPEVFLRGCGVPENLITFLPSLLEQAIQFYSCFISYSHADKSFAQRLHDTLQGRGIRCWIDKKQMNPGDDIYQEIDRGIKYWDKVLLCCSESALSEKWWVDMEINKAFQKERDLMKERGQKVLALIPLDLDGYLFEGYTGAKKDEICSRLAATFNGWEHDNAIFEREVERVIKALRTDGGKEPLPKQKL